MTTRDEMKKIKVGAFRLMTESELLDSVNRLEECIDIFTKTIGIDYTDSKRIFDELNGQKEILEEKLNEIRKEIN